MLSAEKILLDICKKTRGNIEKHGIRPLKQTHFSLGKFNTVFKTYREFTDKELTTTDISKISIVAL